MALHVLLPSEPGCNAAGGLQVPFAMPGRLALLAVLAAVLGAAPLRAWVETPSPAPACVPEGRGRPPRGWLGCAADPGPRRAPSPAERLALGLPIDPNVAGADDLAFVPGLSRRLGAAIVADRTENGPFSSVDDLERVRGVGPKRLGRARGRLEIRAR